MRIDVMRKIDTLVGIPAAYLCALFSRKPRSLWGEKIEWNTSSRILITKFLGLGSTVLATSLISTLEKTGKKITIVTFKESEEFLRLAGIQSEIFTLRKDAVGFFFDTIKIAFALRKINFHLSLDLEPSANFTALFHFVVQAKHRMGFMSGKQSREKLFTHLLSYSSERHLVENFELFAKRLELEVKTNKKRSGKSKEKILININASELSFHRLWIDTSWVQLSEKLLKKYPKHQLVFTGLPSEESRIKRVTSLVRQKVGFTDRVELALGLDLKTLSKRVQEAEIVVSVDSFMLHFAEWCGTKVVGLYGPESPKLTGPRLSDSDVCYQGLTCSPCLSILSQKKTRCEDNQCMKQLTVDKVFKTVVQTMEKNENAKAA